MNPALTVAICTHNRASDAITCVNTLLASARSAQVEIIVIDNASDARHHQRLAGWLSDKPQVRFATENLPGLSHARNLGLQMCSSRWIAYLDDDAVPYEDWLPQAIETVSNAEQDVGFIAGAVYPLWPDTAGNDAIAPEQLGQRWRALLSLLEHQPSSSEALPHVVGCNMLIRSDALRELGGFDPNFGRRPGSLVGGEETDIATRMHARGLRVSFDANLRVFHRIHPERLTRTWVAQRAKAEGVLSARRPTPLRTVVKACLSLPVLGAAVGRDKFMRKERQEGERVVRLWHNIGFVLEAMSPRGRKNIRL